MEISYRNARILDMLDEGKTHREIAEFFGISRGRVGQIKHRYRPDSIKMKAKDGPMADYPLESERVCEVVTLREFSFERDGTCSVVECPRAYRKDAKDRGYWYQKDSVSIAYRDYKSTRKITGFMPDSQLGVVRWKFDRFTVWLADSDIEEARNTVRDFINCEIVDAARKINDLCGMTI